MSRKGNPYDNAKMESFMATLKLEEVELSEYSDFFDVEAQVQTFIEAVYNKKRLHSSLGYLPPDEFEAQFHAMQAQEVMLQ
jgi:transposase InsO family protein